MLATRIPFGSARYHLVRELLWRIESVGYLCGTKRKPNILPVQQPNIVIEPQTEPDPEFVWASFGPGLVGVLPTRPIPVHARIAAPAQKPIVLDRWVEGYRTPDDRTTPEPGRWIKDAPNGTVRVLFNPSSGKVVVPEQNKNKRRRVNKNRTRRSGDTWDRTKAEPFSVDSYGRTRTDTKRRVDLPIKRRTKDGRDLEGIISTRIGWEFLQTIARTQPELTELVNKNRTELATFVRSLLVNPNKFRVRHWEGALEQFVQDVLGSLCGATPNIAKQKPNAPRVRDPFVPNLNPTERYPNGRPLWYLAYSLCSATLRAERKHNIRVRPQFVHIFDGTEREHKAFGVRPGRKTNPNKARSLAASRQTVTRTVSELLNQTEAERISTLSARERQVWVLLGRKQDGRTIAAQLGVTPQRISNIIQTIRRKLGVRSGETIH